MNNNNTNNSQMEKLLKTASGQLGMSAEELKGLLKKGDMESIMSRMGGSDAQKLKDALKKPDVSKMMKDSPEMAEFMKKMKD